ncbi:MAG: T9SS type A sorting domain-containing protein, partial [Bacteroidota bacterium]
EDYKVRVDNFPLGLNLLSFDAKALNNSSIKLNWSADEEPGFTAYDVERSNNGTDWEHVAFVDASHATGTRNYEHTDSRPFKGVSYYRLKLGEVNGATRYSGIKQVTIKDVGSFVTITPNPASDHTIINIYSANAQANAVIKLLDMQGHEIFSTKAILRQGNNPVNLPLQSYWQGGMYLVQV